MACLPLHLYELGRGIVETQANECPALQTLRWGALVFGVFYGFSHQSAISTRDKTAAAQHEYERKQHLINDAKAAWQKKNAPQSQGSSGCKSCQ